MNKLCEQCQNDCKQDTSVDVKILNCDFKPKETKNDTRKK